MIHSRMFLMGLLALLPLLASAQDSWSWQNPRPEGNPLSDVKFVDSLHGWAVGRAGTVLRTTDGGTHWQPVHTPGSEFLSRVSFISPNVGWVLCYDPYTLLKTTDGGITWDSLATFAGSTVFDLTFVDDSVGVACGTDTGAAIWRTSDGGRSWSRTASMRTGNFISLHFPSHLVGWATGLSSGSFAGGTVWKTTDAGRSWTNVSEGSVLLTARQIYALDGNTAFVVGSFEFVDRIIGTCQRTTDAGASWSGGALPAPLLAVYFADPNAGWVLDEGRRMYKTTDGGATWDTLGTQADGFSFANAHWAWAIRWPGLVLTTRDGWQSSAPQIQSVTNQWLTAVSAWDSANVVACGESGSVIGTTDGGRHWAQLQGLQESPGLNDITHTRSGELWTVGERGKVFHSTDGGLSWRPSQLDSAWLVGVAFISPDTGFVTAANGRLYHTKDGGGHWSSQILVPDGRLEEIRFSRWGIGWITSSDGVYRSTDRGQTWLKMDAAGSSLRCPSAVNDHAWFALGNKVVFTADRGVTWQTRQVYPVGNAFYDIRVLTFADPENGWVASSTGSIYRTTDGGLTWNLEFARNAASLSGISFADPRHGWAVGDGGAVLSYEGTPTGITTPADHPLPNRPALLGNYPNPFNPSTTIRYRLPWRSHAVLTVFNLLGQKVVNLVDGDVAAGYHEVLFDAGNLASGVYFYRLRAGAFVDVKPMVLTR